MTADRAAWLLPRRLLHGEPEGRTPYAISTMGRRGRGERMRSFRWLSRWLSPEPRDNRGLTGSPVIEADPNRSRLAGGIAGNANLDPSIAVVERKLRKVFERCSDLEWQRITLPGKPTCLLTYLTSLVDKERLEVAILAPWFRSPPRDGTQWPPPAAQLTEVTTYQAAIEGLLLGKVLLCPDGLATAYLLNLRLSAGREPAEPETEAVVRGPREGFTETLSTNLYLLRRRIQTPALKTERLRIGSITRSEVVLAYLEGIARAPLVREVHRRLSRIRIDGVLESAYLEEFLEDDPWSPFPQIQNTERPDVVVAAVLEGRVAILVDGSPFALLLPCTFLQLLQANEDHYERFLFGSSLRILRTGLLMTALIAPSLYIAITTFHQEMIPTNLLVTVASSREGLPFPALIEALLMEATFEALREAGVRLPRPVGQAVSIVGALVIGQAAIQAGIVSAPMVIVVSITGIASFAIPRYNLALSIRFLRFPLMILSGTLGLFGTNLGLTLIYVHMCALRSFGVSYLSPIAPFVADALKDALVRAPRWAMTRRPAALAGASVRVPAGQRPQPPQRHP